MSSDKPYRMRVSTLDGKPRDRNKLKGLLVAHVDVVETNLRAEFVICAIKEAHLDQVRQKLSAAGLDEVPGGDTTDSAFAGAVSAARQSDRGGAPSGGGIDGLKRKPYGFVPLPETFEVSAPMWHDGTCSNGKMSGEVRCELETLTPLLVGCERAQIGDGHTVVALPGIGQTTDKKPTLCPLRAPWGSRPVLIPGDSLKGLLRLELGALLGAPMERVAERSYSYRPNALFPKDPNPYLIPRLARVPEHGVELVPLDPSNPNGGTVRVPTTLELLHSDLKFDRHGGPPSRYTFDVSGAAPYCGGQGAGVPLNSKRKLHRTLEAVPDTTAQSVAVPPAAQDGFLHTIRHLTDADHGHFSSRHPEAAALGARARNRILYAAANDVFQPGDIIWVEWDTQKDCVVSFGWHYYYRWAYTDSVRIRGGQIERAGLFPLAAEKETDANGAPLKLSPVRRLFGYTGDNDGSKGIGRDDYQQMMGRVSVNAAIEVVTDSDTEEARFLAPTFLRELGMPRPGAVEHYLGQPYYPGRRPSDRASLVTYGDAHGYDKPGELAGRKFYLDRPDAYTGEPWKDDSEANRHNERSTLAFEASSPRRRFRFTVRFRDLDGAELATLMVALSPNQFREILGGTHTDGYCSKLGYARPLGWGSVRIECKRLCMIEADDSDPALKPADDIDAWVRANYLDTTPQSAWLALHRCKHADAGDYPTGSDGQIYTYHTELRAKHTRDRRYK